MARVSDTVKFPALENLTDGSPLPADWELSDDSEPGRVALRTDWPDRSVSYLCLKPGTVHLKWTCGNLNWEEALHVVEVETPQLIVPGPHLSIKDPEPIR